MATVLPPGGSDLPDPVAASPAAEQAPQRPWPQGLSSSRSGPWLDWLVPVATALVFAPALSGAYIWDDLALLDARRVNSLWTLLTTPYLPSQDVWIAPYYRPLAALSLGLERLLFGGSPMLHHGVGVLFHVLCTALVMSLARKLTPASPWLPLVSGLLFGLHPVHVEPIAWISGRPDQLAAFFALACARVSLSERPGSSVLSGALLFLALLSKEAALTLPLGLVLLAGWKGLPRARVTLLAQGLAASLAIGLRALVLNSTSAVLSSGPHEPWMLRPATAARVLLASLEHLLWPVERCMEWEIPRARQALELPLLLVSLLLVSLLAALVLAGRARWRWHTLTLVPRALGFFLVLMVPVSQLYTLDETVADRYLYLPSVGLVLALGSMLLSLNSRMLTIGLLTALSLAGAVLVRQGLQPWGDALAFFEQQVACAPDSARAWVQLGKVRLERGDPAGAKQAWEASLATAPEQVHARQLLANLALEQGQAQEAHAWMERGLDGGPTQVAGLMLLSRILLKLDRPEHAQQRLLEAHELAPDRPDLLHDLGVVSFQLEDVPVMRACFERLLTLEEPTAARLNYVGIARTAMGSPEAGLEAFLQAATLEPNLPGLQCNLARALEGIGEPEQAELARRRCAQGP